MQAPPAGCGPLQVPAMHASPLLHTPFVHAAPSASRAVHVFVPLLSQKSVSGLHVPIVEQSAPVARYALQVPKPHAAITPVQLPLTHSSELLHMPPSGTSPFHRCEQLAMKVELKSCVKSQVSDW
jgi:hypothetical protein